MFFTERYRIPLHAALVALCLTLCPALWTLPAQAETFFPGPVVFEDAADKDVNATRAMMIPYIFGSESLGFSLGLVGAVSRFQDGQMGVAGTVYGSLDEALAGYLSVSNARLPHTERFFFDFLGSAGTYPKLMIFESNGEPGQPDAGTNDSDYGDRLQGRGTDNWIDTSFKCVLPWGGAEKSAISHFVLKDGMLDSAPSGGGDWNPLKSGLTFLEFKPFYRNQWINDKDEGNTHSYSAIGARVQLRYDNTDYPINPSYGSRQAIQVSHGFDAGSASDHWTTMDARYSHYFDLGKPDWARQQVLALAAWTAFTPSSNSPPPFEGATLGNIYRMRGYENFRFHDRAAIWYTAEYRLTPKWNPLKRLPFLDVDWIQPIVFAEAGRVASNWDVVELHTDMKFDAGVGLAVFVNKYLTRMDCAFSPEGWNLRVMVGHPF